MNRSLRTKPLFKLVALGLLGVAALGFFLLVTRAATTVSTSEETEEIFNEAAVLPADMTAAVTWEPDGPGLSRQMEPLTRQDITDSWLRAWAQLSLVSEGGDPSGLDVYFMSSALDGLQASLQEMKGRPIHQIGHDLRLDFYSEDGQIVGLEATNTRLLRAVPMGEAELAWYDTIETYEAVLLLVDGNWRVQHWVRRSVEGRWWTDPAPAAKNPSPPLRGINYYPRETPWASFWEEFDREVVNEDLGRIVALGLNSVRVFIPFEEVGGRHVGPDELQPVVDFLDLAQSHGLEVIVTLFDGRTDHRPARWDEDEAYLDVVVEELASHPALVLWDMKNEPDRDVGILELTDDMLQAWLGHITRYLRQLDPATPATVGWSSGEAAASHPIVGDIVSFHHYAPADELPQVVAEIRSAQPGTPLMLTEFGLPTWNTVLPNGHTEQEQAAYFADVLTIAAILDLDGVLAWTLWDLAFAPPDAGKFPWHTGPQTRLGVIRPDGTEKPAAALLGPGADLASVPRPGLKARLTKPLWLLLLGVVSIGLIGGAFLLKKGRVQPTESVPD